MIDTLTQQEIITRVLRTVGVIAAFIGCILVTQTMVTGLAAMSVSSLGVNVRVSGPFGGLTIWAIVSQLLVVAWGVGLFAAARPIAVRIVED